MSDLISRNEVNDVIDELEVYTCGRPNTMKVEVSVLQLQRFINKLKNIPTAYDVDKVVEEIKTLKEEALGEYNMGEYNLDNNIGNSISENYRKDMNEGRCFAYDDAIEIVEQGGVSDASDDVCEWIKYDYRTICPKNHDVNTPYWRIPDNMDKLKYCPYCGKKILCKE